MKKLNQFILLLFLTFGFSKIVSAASISVTSNVNYATAGGKVTFYVNINGAASWQLTGIGTGATSGCSSEEQGTGDSGTGKNINKTIPFTCNATDVGSISFEVNGNISAVDNSSNISSKNVSGRKIVVVQAPREKDSNNYLKSIGIKDYPISPEFNKETNEYSVEVPSTVDKVTIEATPESNYANITGIGEMEVNEGINNFDITVTSETGVERVYHLKVNVKDNNPIEVKIGDHTYTLIKNGKNLTKPELYEETILKIKEIEIPAFVSEVTKFTLVGVKDENGKIFFAIYNKDKEEYTLYNEQKSSTLLLYIMDPIETMNGYHQVNLEIDGINYNVLQKNENSLFYLVYAMNIETGEKNYFVYHKTSNTFQEYNHELFSEFQKEKEIREYIIIGLGIGIILLFLICIIIFIKMRKYRKRQNNILDNLDEKSDMDSKLISEEEKLEENISQTNFKKSDKVDPEKLYVKDAVQKMNDVEKLIEQYEKTISLSKKELKEEKEK